MSKKEYFIAFCDYPINLKIENFEKQIFYLKIINKNSQINSCEENCKISKLESNDK
jgi:hypothetical protein